jgi:hypothetical protein
MNAWIPKGFREDRALSGVSRKIRCVASGFSQAADYSIFALRGRK